MSTSLSFAGIGVTGHCTSYLRVVADNQFFSDYITVFTATSGVIQEHPPLTLGSV